jgi:ribulose-phosphate 3-epimerase
MTESPRAVTPGGATSPTPTTTTSPPALICPSLLAANFGHLEREARRALRAGADRFHLDIMDGHFVPNVSFGPDVVRVVRPLTKRCIETHLMCAKPEILIEPFAEAGADLIIVHVELTQAVPDLIWKIRSLGKQVGLAINPPTSAEEARRYLKHADLMLVMTVNPGFGGQAFIPEALPKVQQLAAWRTSLGLQFRIEVDGGVNLTTVAECARAGADTFVSGTGLFAQRRMGAAIARMRRLIAQARGISASENHPTRQ